MIECSKSLNSHWHHLVFIRRPSVRALTLGCQLVRTVRIHLVLLPPNSNSLKSIMPHLNIVPLTRHSIPLPLRGTSAAQLGEVWAEYYTTVGRMSLEASDKFSRLHGWFVRIANILTYNSRSSRSSSTSLRTMRETVVTIPRSSLRCPRSVGSNSLFL